MPVIRDVQTEANVAKSNARLLIEALAFTSPAEMESNPIIQEFHAKCLQNQNQLMDDIPWATEQAARARTYHQQQQQQQAVPPHTQEPALNGEVTSREEQLLSLLLSANSELVDAFRQYEELERLARNERELRLVEERSRHETSRFSSHAPTGFLDPHALYHQYQPRASGSSSNASSRPSLEHSDHHGQSPPVSASLGQQQQQQQQINTIIDEDSHSSADHDHYPRAQHSPHPTTAFPHQPSDDSNMHHPNPEPSQKARGKMRRVSSA